MKFAILEKLREALMGRKSYLLAVAMIAYAVIGYVTGHDAQLDTTKIWEALSVMALRAGITKSGQSDEGKA